MRITETALKAMTAAAKEASAVTLVYDANIELLTGVIPGEPPFKMPAYSGGSRGHKINQPEAAATAYLYQESNMAKSHYGNTALIQDKNGEYVQRGGTLPPGIYRCEFVLKSHLGQNVIHLKPVTIQLKALARSRGLNTFYIHGRGPKGSDGCIVPKSESERVRLSKAIERYKGNVYLSVEKVAYILPARVDEQMRA